MAEKSFLNALPKEYCLVCFKEVNFILRDDEEFVHIRTVFIYKSYVRSRVTKRLPKLSTLLLEVYSTITKTDFLFKKQN